MRFRGGFGRACALFGALVLASTVSACLGQDPEPQKYELGGTALDRATLSQAAAGEGPTAGEPNGQDFNGQDFGQDFASQAGDVVYFTGDSAELSEGAKATLRKQISWLNRHKGHRVMVEGHADEWGTLQHNLSLGARRAVAVKTYLQRNGLHARRVQTLSYGKERQVRDCTTLICRAKNRRAQTVVSPPVSIRSAEISR